MENQLVETLKEELQKLYYENSKFFMKSFYKKSGLIKELLKMDKEQILKTLKEGIQIERYINNKLIYYDTTNLINYKEIEKNTFEVFSEVNINEYIYDAIITINGIPIVLIECANDVDRGCLQLQKHLLETDKVEELKSIQILVSIDNKSLKYKTNDSKTTWKEWHIEADEEKETIEKKIEKLFNQKTLLNLLKNYIIWINARKEIATYYQYFATQKAIESKKDKNKIYLPTGSGKTTTTLFMLNKIKERTNKEKTLIVVERVIMQDILKEKIESSLKYKTKIADSKVELEKLINDTTTNIIITTIQMLKSYNKENIEKLYIIADISSSYSEQVLYRIKNEIFKNSILTQFTSNKEIDQEYDYCYTIGQAIQDQTITKVFYSRRNAINLFENIQEDIENNFYDIKEKKAIIITKKEDCIKYIKKIGTTHTISTTSILDTTEEYEFLENIIRENGNLENYRNESLQSFNNGKLEILVISTIEELQEVITSKVERVYLTKEIPNKMIPILFKIMSKKSEKKERSVIVDYAENTQRLIDFRKQEEEQKENIIPEIKQIIQDTRKISISLYIEQKYIVEKLSTIKGLNSKNILIEAELFLDKVIKLLRETAFIFSSEELLNSLEKNEPKEYQIRILNYLKIIDKIAVITTQEIKEKKFIQECCSMIKLEPFEFTPIRKSDLWKYPNIEGAWEELTEIQKTIAIKNRLKMYKIIELKIQERLEEIERKYQNKEIDDNQYFIEIEKIRVEYKTKIKYKKIPDKVKNEQFTLILYNYLENAKIEGKILFYSEQNIANIIIEIKNKIKEKMKVNWKSNYYLWRQIELGIIEIIYDSKKRGEIFIKEENLDELLLKIKEIAFETLDYYTEKPINNLYYIKKKNAYAVLQVKENGRFVILKNSTTVDGYSKNMREKYIKEIENLRKKGTIVNNQFMKDEEFTSLSAAANVILGRSSNGKIEWKDKEGRTYAQCEEKGR